MIVHANIKNVGAGTVTLTLHFGSLGTASDNVIRTATGIAAGNFWHMESEVFFLTSTKYGVNSANVNTFAAANYDERATNYDTSGVLYLAIGASSGTAGATNQVLQLMVMVA